VDMTKLRDTDVIKEPIQPQGAQKSSHN